MKFLMRKFLEIFFPNFVLASETEFRKNKCNLNTFKGILSESFIVKLGVLKQFSYILVTRKIV